MNPSYIIRLDDACPTTWGERFHRVEQLLLRYDVAPLLAVIPENHDEELMIEPLLAHFWDKVRFLKSLGWTVAQHGCHHRFATTRGGLLNIHPRSEFAGLPPARQRELIARGRDIMQQQKLLTDIWVAPAHSFDRTTCRVLRDLDFRYISDGIGLFPFDRFGLTWIPQQLGSFKKWPAGLATVCLHPHLMTEPEFQRMERFLARHRRRIVSFPEALRRWQQTAPLIRKIAAPLLNTFCRGPFYLRLRWCQYRKATLYDRTTQKKIRLAHQGNLV